MTWRDVVDVEPGAVEGAVGGDRAEHLADRLQAALPRGLGGLDDERRRAHPDDHAVPAPVERRRRVLDHVVGRGGAGGQEAGGDPGQQRVAGDVVGGDHDDPAAAAGPDPVLGQRHRLRRARARGVDLGVGAARADDLGELRVAHRQAPEQEPPVEGERLGVEQVAQLADAPVDLGRGRLVAAHPGPHRLQGEQLLATAPVGVVPSGPRRRRRSRGTPRRRSRRCRRAARRAAPTGRAAWCRAWWSCSASPAGCRRRAGRRSRRRWPAGSRCRAPRRGPASTPNSATTSSGACRPASLMTSASSSMVSKVGSPDSRFTSRVMCMSTICCRSRCGMVSMNCWPSRIRCRFSSSKTRSTPGRPSAAPVMTTGSGDAGAPGRSAGGGPWRRRRSCRPCSRTSANSRPSSTYWSWLCVLARAVAQTRCSAVGDGVGRRASGLRRLPGRSPTAAAAATGSRRRGPGPPPTARTAPR